jgi:hypothetical protein
MVVCLATSVASAEGVGPRSDGGPARIQGVTTMLPTPGGLVTIGGPALRRLAPGARRWETLHTIAGDNLYRVDGRFQPQLLYREEHAHRIFDSKRGSLFAFPKHIGQECDHLTCFPITEIVAYEITDAGIRRQTVLRGDGWGPGFYLAGATAVRGSDDERVAMVVDLHEERRQVLAWRRARNRALALGSGRRRVPPAARQYLHHAEVAVDPKRRLHRARRTLGDQT